MRAHALDRQMRLASVGRAENRLDGAVVHDSDCASGVGPGQWPFAPLSAPFYRHWSLNDPILPQINAMFTLKSEGNQPLLRKIDEE
jgi:hypothetical protein